MSRPLRIAISSCFFHADPKRLIFKGKTLVYIEQSMANWAMAHGALAYMIPPASGKVSVADLVREMDGLMLHGGSDVSPRTYGEEPMKPEWSGDFVRDQYEISLLKEFMTQGKPVLGICRGAQLVNVAFGGTLYQDIATQRPEAGDHRNWDIYDQNFHSVRLKEGSGLSKLYPGMKTGKINTIHHQAVKDLGNGLVVEAVSEDDGIVEAIRLKGPEWVFAVQWHPEYHDPADSRLLDSRPLMEDFLDQVRKRTKR